MWDGVISAGVMMGLAGVFVAVLVVLAQHLYPFVKKYLNKPTNSKSAPEEVIVKKASPSKAHYKTAWMEIEQNKRDMGVWGEAFATCEGDETKAIAKYIELRAAYLSEFENEVIEETRILKRKRDEIRFHALQLELKDYSYKLYKEGDRFFAKRGMFAEKVFFDSLDDVNKFHEKLMNKQAIVRVAFVLVVLFIIGLIAAAE
jgi:hypothetical protein